MTDPRVAVLDYYARHPISLERVLAALGREGAGAGPLAPEALWALDQDHYGGVAAVATLARRAGLVPGMRVLDVCGGLGGPARYLAHRLDARVIAVDLHPERCRGAARLTALAGLAGRVRVVRGDAQALPLRAGGVDAVISQEGLLHVPDKAAALAECARVLVPGGRLAFTDWVATARLADGERRRLAEWMAAFALPTVDAYRRMLGAAGFVAVEAEDCTREWIEVVRRRREAHRALRAAGGPAGAEAAAYDRLHAFFVGLLEGGRLAGARVSGTSARAGA